MGRIIKALDKAIYFIVEKIIVLCLISLFILVFLMVITRNFFGWYWEGAQEVCQFFIIWITFFGAVLAARNEKHISMSALLELAPERVGVFGLLVINIISAIACMVIAVAGLNFSYTSLIMGHETSALRAPVWLWYLPLPISLFLISIIFGAKAFQIIIKMRCNKNV